MRAARLAFLLPLACASHAALACYTVYDPAGRVVYQSEQAPVDMSRPLHETVPARFPGGQMIFDNTSECTVINSVALGRGGTNMATTSPLLTDESTARALRLPHSSLGQGIALVAPGDVRMAPGVMVVPSPATLAQQRPEPGDTRYLGGPARR